jgi:hypothetical protein
MERFFRRLMGVFHKGLGVAQCFLHFALNLQLSAIDFLLGVAHNYACLCLRLVGGTFAFACDVVFVHDGSLELMNENEYELFQGSGVSIDNDRLRVCVLAYKCGQ